jgi:hypothetical protein
MYIFSFQSEQNKDIFEWLGGGLQDKATISHSKSSECATYEYNFHYSKSTAEIT